MTSSTKTPSFTGYAVSVSQYDVFDPKKFDDTCSNVMGGDMSKLKCTVEFPTRTNLWHSRIYNFPIFHPIEREMEEGGGSCVRCISVDPEECESTTLYGQGSSRP